MDALFLYWERPNQPMHFGEILVYEDQVSALELRESLSARMHLLPRYRQRAVFSPLHLAHPVWEDDPEFDVGNHVHEMLLPPPGDNRALSQVASGLLTGMLDRRRPLWDLWLLQGHESGRSILLVRLHHAMVDGLSTMRVIEVMHDLEPNCPPPEPPPEPWVAEPGPGTVTRLVDAVGDQISLMAQTTGETLSWLDPRQLPNRVRGLRTLGRTLATARILPPPRTPFNAPISDRRDFAWIELPLEDLKAIRKARGGTVNHVVVAILSGGLRRYMQRRGHDPDGKPLRMEAPVGMRPADKRDALGNLVSLVFAPLRSDIDDPLRRYDEGRREMDRVKEIGQAEGLSMLIEWSNRWPAALHSAVWRWAPTWLPYPCNIVSTNVPGPKEALYLGGHKVVGFHPLGPLWTTLGAILCTVSYTDKITLTLVVDPELIPDVWDAIDDFRAAYDELYSSAVGDSPGPLARPGRRQPSARASARRQGIEAIPLPDATRPTPTTETG